MPKVIPPCPQVPENRRSGRETREYQVQIVSPLFGGGVEAGQSDASLPIRGTAVRGQLQFWWRATRGSLCTTREELFDRHKKIWGTTDKASSVEIEILSVDVPEPPRACARYAWNPGARQGRGGWRLDWDALFRGTALPYALFPFQGQAPLRFERDSQPEKFPAHFIEHGRLRLRVRFPKELHQDVETAVWAWVNFGGLGARTRRGCGSLFGREPVRTGDRCGRKGDQRTGAAIGFAERSQNVVPARSWKRCGPDPRLADFIIMLVLSPSTGDSRRSMESSD